MKPHGNDWSASIASRYGRKMGLLRHYLHLARYMTGSYDSLKTVDWSRVERLVFICKGNICRSPYAEAKARAMGLPCSSFGLEPGVNSPANASAIRVARARGVDLTQHRARGASNFSITNGDLLTVMEPWHVAVLRSRPMPAGTQVTLLGLWCSPRRPHLEDPYGLSDEYFQTCYETIDKAIETMSALRDKANANLQPR
jgi:protein-tyrosine phosphatase